MKVTISLKSHKTRINSGWLLFPLAAPLQFLSARCDTRPRRQMSSKRHKKIQSQINQQLRPRSIMEETEQGWLKKTQLIHFCHRVTAPTRRDQDPRRRTNAF